MRNCAYASATFDCGDDAARDCAAAGAVTKATAEHAKIAEPKNLSALCGLCGCSIAISPIIMLKLFHKCGKVSYSRCHARRSRAARDSRLSPLQDAGHARQKRNRAEVCNV